jgi:hypothetical protein
MYKLEDIIVVIVILVVVSWLFGFWNKKSTVSKEGFRVNSKNWPYNNVGEVAYRLGYGDTENAGMYVNGPPNTMGPSSNTGVNANSAQDTFDNRGYKWTAPAKDPEVDVLTAVYDDKQLRQKFERTYMLDPDGSVAQYDPTYFKISPSCCPAQYAPPFKVTDKDESNCDYAQKYVANNYSGMNYQDGYGCVCMTPKQADFYGTRGGNTV